jgi:myosin heavy subunit
MAPKKKKAGGAKKGKKLTVDSEDLKSFNLAQREVLAQLLNRMQELQATNAELRQNT